MHGRSAETLIFLSATLCSSSKQFKLFYSLYACDVFLLFKHRADLNGFWFCAVRTTSLKVKWTGMISGFGQFFFVWSLHVLPLGLILRVGTTTNIMSIIYHTSTLYFSDKTSMVVLPAETDLSFWDVFHSVLYFALLLFINIGLYYQANYGLSWSVGWVIYFSHTCLFGCMMNAKWRPCVWPTK